MFILRVILFLIVLASPLFYSLILLFIRLFIISAATLYSVIPRLLGLLILLVYYGAIIILISYVCSVSPNLNYDFYRLSDPLFLAILTIACGSLISLFVPISVISFSPLILTSFFYSYAGSYCFVLVCIFMLVVLFFCSIYTQVSSPFRSVS